MRYVAKIHVLDVMDKVVVSGYVHGSEGYNGESPEVAEFSYEYQGIGMSDAALWLSWALYNACVDMAKPESRGGISGLAEGRSHTISGSGDTGK